MEQTTADKTRELRESIEQLNEVMRSFDEEPHHYGIPNQDRRVTVAWKAADHRYRAAVQALADDGITNDVELEHAMALQANPDYREPHGLGHIIVDEEDFDIDVGRDVGMGISR